MTYYLYKHPSGQPELASPHPLPPAMVGDLTLMGVFPTPPDISNRVFDKENRLVPVVPDYVVARRPAYPRIGDQLDALWKEFGPNMKHPEAKAMYEKIKQVKDENPKITDVATGTPMHPLPHREAPNFPPEPVAIFMPVPEPTVVDAAARPRLFDTKLKETRRASNEPTIDPE